MCGAIVSAYGKVRANEVFRIFNSEMKTDVSASQPVLGDVCAGESRLQLIHFLFGIAGADGSV